MGTHLHPYVCLCGVDVDSVDRAQMLNHHKISNNSLLFCNNFSKQFFISITIKKLFCDKNYSEINLTRLYMRACLLGWFRSKI